MPSELNPYVNPDNIFKRTEKKQLKNKQTRTEHSRTVEQFQKVQNTYNWTTRKENRAKKYLKKQWTGIFQN